MKNKRSSDLADTILGFTVLAFWVFMVIFLLSSCVTVRTIEDPNISNCRNYCSPDRAYYDPKAHHRCTCYLRGPKGGRER